MVVFCEVVEKFWPRGQNGHAVTFMHDLQWEDPRPIEKYAGN